MSTLVYLIDVVGQISVLGGKFSKIGKRSGLNKNRERKKLQNLWVVIFKIGLKNNEIETNSATNCLHHVFC